MRVLHGVMAKTNVIFFFCKKKKNIIYLISKPNTYTNNKHVKPHKIFTQKKKNKEKQTHVLEHFYIPLKDVWRLGKRGFPLKKKKQEKTLKL